MIEAFIDDLRIGIVPNIFSEKGWQAEWKYNRKGLLQNVALGIAIASAVLVMLKLKVKSE